MAARYQGRVRAYEIWNEQNLYYEWGNEPIDPGRYMELLKLAYTAIKAATRARSSSAAPSRRPARRRPGHG